MKFQNSDENRFFIPIDGIAWYWLVLQGYWLVFHGVVWHVGELPCGASCNFLWREEPHTHTIQ